MSDTSNNDNPIDIFFTWFDNGLRWAREQVDRFIADYPQTSRTLTIAACDISSKFITDVYKPMALQNIKNISALNEQNKIYYSSLPYFPFNKNSFMNAIYDIRVRKYDDST